MIKPVAENMRRIKPTLLSILIAIATTAAAQKTDLKTTLLLGGQVELKVPVDFYTMSSEQLKSKYTLEEIPLVAYSDKSDLMNLVVTQNAADSASQLLINAYKDNFVQRYKSDFPDAHWKGAGINVVNGRKVGFLELVIEEGSKNNYRLIFFTDVNGRLMICTFNCPKKKMKKWTPVAHLIMNSLKIN